MSDKPRGTGAGTNANGSKCGEHREIVATERLKVTRCPCGSVHVHLHGHGLSLRVPAEHFAELARTLQFANEVIEGVNAPPLPVRRDDSIH